MQTINLKLNVMKNYLKRIVLSGLILSLLSGSILAQNIWMQNLPKSNIQLDIRSLRPFLKNDSDLGILTSSSEISINIPVHPNINVLASVPVSIYSFETEDREIGIGNIFIGFQSGEKDLDGKNVFVSGGIYLPTASSESYNCLAVGMLSNLCDTYKLFPKTTTLYSNLGYHTINKKGFNWGLEMGPRIMIPTEKSDSRRIELSGNYGLKAGYNTGSVLFSGELLGLFSLHEGEISFFDRFYHTGVVSATITKGKVRPSVFYNFGIKKGYFDYMSGVAGVKLEVNL